MVGTSAIQVFKGIKIILTDSPYSRIILLIY